MSMYLGDFIEDATVHLSWSTFGADGASITRATNGTVSVYKDAGTTQSTAGITDSEDFDSLTGIHWVTIDTSADAFYATGHNYTVVLSGSTIDGKTVNAILGTFSIENRNLVDVSALATATALTTVEGKVDTIDSNVDAIKADTDAYLDASVSSRASQTSVDDVPTNAELATALAGADDAVIAHIGAGGANLNALPWPAAWDAEVQSEVTDALNAYDPPTRAELTSDMSGIPDAVWDEVLSESDFQHAWSGITPRKVMADLFAGFRNKWTSTNSSKVLRNDADSAALGTRAISDNGTTYTDGEMG